MACLISDQIAVSSITIMNSIVCYFFVFLLGLCLGYSLEFSQETPGQEQTWGFLQEPVSYFPGVWRHITKVLHMYCAKKPCPRG